VAKFEEVRRRYGTDPVADEAKVALARLYEGQGKTEEAFKLYEEVMKTGMGSQGGLAMEAQMRLQELVKKHPDLIKPKQPIVTPPSFTPAASSGSNVQVIRLTNQPVKSTTNITLTPKPVYAPPPLLARPPETTNK
jgi:hypothetical protein